MVVKKSYLVPIEHWWHWQINTHTETENRHVWFWYPFTFYFYLLIFLWSVIFHSIEQSGKLSELPVWQRWKGEKSGADVQQWEIYLYWVTHISAAEELVGSSIKPHITTDVPSAAALIPVFTIIFSASWHQVFWPFCSIQYIPANVEFSIPALFNVIEAIW